ncbi:DUF4861 domain-containing protein [Seonamhaeicola sediminis]|uniref:DUF4861 domain-containing protein n=1 Tax=Seonamhaeicola sediminis TaxID=2528206 RepID=A0A562YD86_9FLAO|nr:DUF4861 family protein [Seonamhaeicola sediminis]TWO32092.1 DUF4861 domain-containing protein [Seonamhaeicola sediminis]
MKVLKLLILFLCLSCSQEKNQIVIEITNSLDIERKYETVELSKGFLELENLEGLGVKDLETNKLLTSQLVDNDGDGVNDVLLFQPNVPAGATNNYQVTKVAVDTAEVVCYSRFVPERTDDYAWENNKVAFRTYGPNAQYRFENKLKEGTLSSGIDAWLKRVEYSIIDKWYKKYTEKTGTYHKDTGEGLDNFHVGSSRGVGGIAYKKDSTFYISKNFLNYKTITTGPLRTSFTLDYGTWEAGDTLIKESKKITLDYGNNLSKFEISIEGVDSISAGLTLHEKDGVVTSNKEETWLNYWQPHDDAELGTAIVTTPAYFLGTEKYETEQKDLSNAFMHLKVISNKVVYYAGFTWSKSNQFKNQNGWEQYLHDFAKKLNTPLEVKLVK